MIAVLQHSGHSNIQCSYTVITGEGQEPVSITFSELRQRVCVLSCALRECGVGRGDRVVGYLPNSSLAVEAMLATTSLGAVWSSTSPDFGVTVSGMKLNFLVAKDLVHVQ